MVDLNLSRSDFQNLPDLHLPFGTEEDAILSSFFETAEFGFSCVFVSSGALIIAVSGSCKDVVKIAATCKQNT